MSWTVINEALCTQCGICARICPGCYRNEAHRMVSQADDQTCVLCGKCVAICPEGAIVHEKMDMNNFPPVSDRRLIETENFIQFIRERRAHRIFKNTPIAQSDLEMLTDTVRYAPTGHNAMDVEIIVARRPERIKALSDLAVEFQVESLAKLKARIDEKKAGGATAEETAALEGRAGFLEMIVHMHSSGLDPIFYQAPAIMIFHATAKEITPKDDCVIAATTAGLLARTVGLETTFIAMFEWAANSYPPLRQALKLPVDNKVFSVLVLGYPQFKYKKAPDRRPAKVRWE